MTNLYGKLGVMNSADNAMTQSRPLTYLACPYSSSDPDEVEWRYRQATLAAAWLLGQGMNVFSPITHSHPLHKIGGLSGDWKSWEKIDREYLSVSNKLVVLLLEGWSDSVGVSAERSIAQTYGIPVTYLLGSRSHGYIFTDNPQSYLYPKYEAPEPKKEPLSRPLQDCRCKVPEGMDNPKDLIGRTKPPLWLIPSVGLLYISRVMGLGAKKYGPYNWREKAVRYTVYLEAAMRHILSALDGEEIDPESKQPHTAHAAACMLIILDAKSINKLVDDRPTPGATARVIEELTEKKA